jgi:replicative DNA helicase
VFVDETPEVTPLGIKAIARRIQAEHGLGLIVVDYLQLMRANQRTDNREQEIAEISRGLKAVAKELNVPVLACAQLNRALEGRPDKRPRLSDLRESGAIEQDADLVMFIYRDEVYNPDTEDHGIAEIHIAKHRNGPITTTKSGIRLAFIPQFTKFARLSLRSDDAPQMN